MDKKRIQSLISFEGDNVQDTSTGFVSATAGDTDILATKLSFAAKNIHYLEDLKETLWQSFIEIMDTYKHEDVFREDNYGYFLYRFDKPIKVVSTLSHKPINITNIEYKPDNNRLIFSSDKTERGIEKHNAGTQDLLNLLYEFVVELTKKLK